MDYDKKQRIYKTIMLVVLTVTITFIATAIGIYKYLADNKSIKYVMLPTSDSPVTSEISRLRTILDKFYLGEINEEELKDSTLKGYIAGLNDEYSEYIPKKEMQDFSASTTGNYDGIGIYYGRLKETNEIAVIAPIKDTPAYNAGILAGDIILKIDDVEVKTDDTLTDISNKIKGTPGTTVKLNIKRGEEIKEFVITRDNIKLHRVEGEVINDNIGYIEFSSFDEETSKQFEERLLELKNKGIKGLIIDIRNNGGGIVQEATKIADYFLKKDSTILITKDKNGDEDITKAKNEPIFDLPVIILTNQNTASASEILAGALKDNGVAKIVGTKTFGKGVIQNIFTLTDGAALKLTTSEYFTPSNKKINHEGIEPDVNVELPKEMENILTIEKEDDVQLQQAIEMLK